MKFLNFKNECLQEANTDAFPHLTMNNLTYGFCENGIHKLSFHLLNENNIQGPE